ncbi:MAG: hypothetical protein H0W63_11720, partial [Gemmatimonadaceae bacterium]|nr:hypothetical protein [Gemmatimonadaceae bacterium]
MTQFVVAAGADRKWLLNSSALLKRPLRLTPHHARWWGLVRILDKRFGLQLKQAASIANRTLAQRGDDGVFRAEDDPSATATLVIDKMRYDSIATANLSRAIVRETPRRRGRRSSNQHPLAAARRYGIDIGLIEASLK